MHTFGASAPLKQLLAKFGFTPDAVAEVARECLAAVRRMTDDASPLRRAPTAWSALEAPLRRASASRHLRDLFAEDPERGERLAAEARRHLPRLLEEPRHRRDDASCSRSWPSESGLEQRRDMMFRGDRINVVREPLGPPRRAAHAARARRSSSTASTSSPQVHEVLDRMAAFAERDPLRRVEGPHRQADPQRRQRRHRRLRPRAGHGVRGAAPLHATAT